MGEERVVLEDHADPPLLGRHHDARAGNQPAIQPDLASHRGLEPGDAAEHRGLAAAARAEQTADRAALEREREATHDRVVVVGLMEVSHLEQQAGVARGRTHILLIIRMPPP